MLALYKSVIEPAFTVPMQWTGNTAGCVAGTTSAEYKAAVVRTVNSYRVLSGLPGTVSLNLTQSAKAQQGALMMQANNTLSHDPTADWLCSSVDGILSAHNSNLALGNAGPSAVHAYMADTGTPDLGHRRWVLYPQLGEVGTGDTARANVLWVFGAKVTAPVNASILGVAWPPRGFVPWSVKVADPVHPWSFSLPDADFGTTTVSVTNDQGQALTLSNVGVLHKDYGDNTIGWRIPTDSKLWSRAPADTKFTVKLSNVIVNKQAKSFEYTVTFIVP